MPNREKDAVCQTVFHKLILGQHFDEADKAHLDMCAECQAMMNRHAEGQRIQARFLEELAVAPVVDLLGVVEPFGASGGMNSDNSWTLTFKFAAWRVADGGMQTRDLLLSRRSLTHEQLRDFMCLLKPYSVIRITARVVTEFPGRHPGGELVEYVGVDNSDAELQAYSAQLQKPVTFEDPVLGTFTLDRRLDCYSANIPWNGKPISLSVSPTAPDELNDALKTALSLWQNQKEWTRRVCDYAVEQLLPLKNDTWLDEGEHELTASQFEKRMTLDSITVRSDGVFEFWHDDGDLFWGHSIEIRGSLEQGLTHADIPG